MLRNTVGGGRLSDFCETSVSKMYSSTLLALRGGGCQINLTKIIYTKKYGLKKNETEL